MSLCDCQGLCREHGDLVLPADLKHTMSLSAVFSLPWAKDRECVYKGVGGGQGGDIAEYSGCSLNLGPCV